MNGGHDGKGKEEKRNVKINNSNGKSVCVGLGFGGSRASSARGLTVERCCGGVTAADAGAGLGAGALVSVAGCAGCGASVISVCVAFVLSILCRKRGMKEKKEDEDEDDEGGRGCSQRLIHWKWGGRWGWAWSTTWSRPRPCGVAHPPTGHGSQVGGRRGTVVSWSGSDSDRSAAHTLFTCQKSVEHCDCCCFVSVANLCKLAGRSSTSC